eukprot:15433986-Alexandrium_andersonii.AAC.1
MALHNVRALFGGLRSMVRPTDTRRDHWTNVTTPPPNRSRRRPKHELSRKSKPITTTPQCLVKRHSAKHRARRAPAPKQASASMKHCAH